MRTCPHCGESLTKPKAAPVDADEVPVACVPCSPKAAKFVQECDDIQAGVTRSKGKYPLDALPIGYSFCELLSKRGKVAASVSMRHKKKDKRFKVIAHFELGLVEIVRVK